MPTRLVVDVRDLRHEAVRQTIVDALQTNRGTNFAVEYVDGRQLISPVLNVSGYHWRLTLQTDVTRLKADELPWRLSQAFVIAGLASSDYSVTRASPEMCAKDLRAASLRLQETSEGPPASVRNSWHAEVVTCNDVRYRLVPLEHTGYLMCPSDKSADVSERARYHSTERDLYEWLERVGMGKWYVYDHSVRCLEVVEHTEAAPATFSEWVRSYVERTR